MGNEQAVQAAKGHEEPDLADLIDKRFAQFGQRRLTDDEIWALSMAAMVMPDGNPGAEAYLMKVARAANFAPRLTVWGRVVAIGIAEAQCRPRGGQRRRTYVEGYSEAWGRFAVADGLTLALYGTAPGLVERCDTLKCGKQGYQRIRDFVGSALLSAIAEYKTALEWALGQRRDRVFEGRWEGVTGLNWDEAKSRVTMGWERGSYYPLFAPGCALVEASSDSDDKQTPDPETLYHGLRPTAWWDESYARRTRLECPARTIYPATD